MTTFKNITFNKDNTCQPTYTSNNTFNFVNDKVSFNYKIVLKYHSFQEGCFNKWKTTYQIILLVDESSIHKSLLNNPLYNLTCSFILKEKTKNGKFDENFIYDFVNVVDDKLIEKNIKVAKYQKIYGILNGTDFVI